MYERGVHNEACLLPGYVRGVHNEACLLPGYVEGVYITRRVSSLGMWEQCAQRGVSPPWVYEQCAQRGVSPPWVCERCAQRGVSPPWDVGGMCTTVSILSSLFGRKMCTTVNIISSLFGEKQEGIPPQRAFLHNGGYSRFTVGLMFRTSRNMRNPGYTGVGRAQNKP